MKKIGIICLICCLFLNILLLPVSAAQVDLQTGAVLTGGNCSGLDADSALLGTDKIVDNAQAVFLYDRGTETLMYALNPDEQIAPSSLVKLMTALIAVESCDLQETVKVRGATVESLPAGAAAVELVDGEQLSLNDLLYCMLVGSANDAAAVIADHISGSQDAFVEKMNARARELGCTGTNFKNVHGLHNDEQYSTVRDITRILAEALKYESFETVFSTVRYTVPATNKSAERSISTGNYLMNADSVQIYYDERVRGGRTGIANDGTRCLAATADSNGLQLISVLVGAESVVEEDGYTVKIFGGFRETTALFDAGFNGYKAVRILYVGQALTQVGVLNGNNDVVLGPNVDISAVVPANTSVSDLSFRTQLAKELKAPVDLGQRVAQTEVWLGSICIAKADLYALNGVAAVESSQPQTKSTIFDRAFVATLCVILGAVIFIALLVFGVITMRRMQVFKNVRRNKRYRSSRRRSR